MGQTFDGADLPTLGLKREHRTGFDRMPIEQHSATAALAGVAAHMRAGQTQRLAQHIGQEHARLDLQLMRLAIDSQFKQMRHGES